MTTPEQQDFEEFDALVKDDEALVESDAAYETETVDAKRKKRQSIFYIATFLMVSMAAAAGWFVFMGPFQDEAEAPVPLTSVATPPSAPVESQTAPPVGGALPPGVITPEDMANASGGADPVAAPADPLVPSEMLDAVPTPDNAMMDDQGMSDDMAAMPTDGTVAEALPPPEMISPAVPAETIPVLEDANDAEASALPVTQTEPVMASTPVEQPVLPVASPELTAPQALPETSDSLVPLSPVETAPVAAASPVIDNRLSQMEQQIQALTSELAAAKSAMSAMATPAAAAESPELSGQLRKLDEKLDRVTQQVEALDERTTSFAAELQNRADAPVTPVAAPKPKASKPKSSPKPAAKPAPKPQASAVSAWQLRSAQPGLAWLSRSGSDEMGRYAVGQSVPGLGAVQEVRQENGRWIVKTSGGTIYQ